MEKTGYYLLKAITWFIQLFPLRVHYLFSDLFFNFAFHIIRYRRSVVDKNLVNSFPDKTQKDRDRIARNFYRHFCDTFVETLYFDRISITEGKECVKYLNPELPISYLDQGRDVIVVLGHYNNWEWFANWPLYSAHQFYPIYKKLKNKAFERFYLHLRSRFGAMPLERAATFRQLISDHQNGTPSMSAFIFDQTPRINDIHHWVTFLNQDTPVILGAEKVAQKLDAVVGLTDEIKSQLGAAQAAAEDARKQAAGLKVDASDVKSKLKALDKSLGLANAAVDDLKNKIASGISNTGSPDVSGLTSRVEKLESGLAAVNNRPIATAKADAAQLTQGLTNLSAKIASGASYQDEIKLLSQMIPSAEGLDLLNSNAKTGVVTKQALAAGLKEFVEKTANPVVVAEVKDDSWWGRTSAIFSGLITIKSVGEVDWKQVASQAVGLVNSDQTAEAVKLLEQNLDTLPQTLQDWRVNAAKRVAVDQALELVNRAVTREIAARG